MPARKPTGAATSAATSTIGSVRRIGCQPAAQRMSTTIPNPIAPKSGVIHRARTRPPPRSSRRQRPPPVGLGAWWTSCAVAVLVLKVGSPLRARLLVPQPCVERPRLHHDRLAAHRGVPQPAQLVADERVGADAR